MGRLFTVGGGLPGWRVLKRKRKQHRIKVETRSNRSLYTR